MLMRNGKWRHFTVATDNLCLYCASCIGFVTLQWVGNKHTITARVGLRTNILFSSAWPTGTAVGKWTGRSSPRISSSEKTNQNARERSAQEVAQAQLK